MLGLYTAVCPRIFTAVEISRLLHIFQTFWFMRVAVLCYLCWLDTSEYSLLGMTEIL
jgi:hypothetical protein